jgi:hypothetical protein
MHHGEAGPIFYHASRQRLASIAKVDVLCNSDRRMPPECTPRVIAHPQLI